MKLIELIKREKIYTNPQVNNRIEFWKSNINIIPKNILEKEVSIRVLYYLFEGDISKEKDWILYINKVHTKAKQIDKRNYIKKYKDDNLKEFSEKLNEYIDYLENNFNRKHRIKYIEIGNTMTNLISNLKSYKYKIEKHLYNKEMLYNE